MPRRRRSSPGAGRAWPTSSAPRPRSSPGRCRARPPARCSSASCGPSSPRRRRCSRDRLRGFRMTKEGSAISAWPAPPGRGSALGLSIASHSGLPPAGIGALAAAAERAGFTAVAVAEGHGDALSLCHPVAAATRRVRVGTAIANAALRPPVLTAKTAAQLDQAASGRFILGLGVGNAVMNARFGLSPFAPLEIVEEYVGVVRSVLNRGTGYDGRLFRTGMVPLDSPPVRAGLPVWLGALGPRMLALAGRIADGVILNLMTPAQAGQAAGIVRDAARAAGRDPASVEVACV